MRRFASAIRAAGISRPTATTLSRRLSLFTSFEMICVPVCESSFFTKRFTLFSKILLRTMPTVIKSEGSTVSSASESTTRRVLRSKVCVPSRLRWKCSRRVPTYVERLMNTVLMKKR